MQKVNSLGQVMMILEHKEPESESLEYKTQTTPQDIIHWICAIANRSGGRIVIGVEAKNQLPDSAPGWTCPHNFENAVKSLLVQITKPARVLDDVDIRSFEIPGKEPLCLTVIEIPNIPEPVWIHESSGRAKGDMIGHDLLEFRDASSKRIATLREDYMEIIRGKLQNSHFLADKDFQLRNYSGARDSYCAILTTDLQDVRAWLGKARCSSMLGDSLTAIDSFREAGRLQIELTRGAFCETILDIYEGLSDDDVKTRLELNEKSREFTVMDSQKGNPQAEHLLRTVGTVESLVGEFIETFGESAESHVFESRKSRFRREWWRAVWELQKANEMTSDRGRLANEIHVDSLALVKGTDRTLINSAFAFTTLLIFMCLVIQKSILRLAAGTNISDNLVPVLVVLVSVILALIAITKITEVRRAAKRLVVESSSS